MDAETQKQFIAILSDVGLVGFAIVGGYLSYHLINVIKPHLTESQSAWTKKALTYIMAGVIPTLVGLIPTVVDYMREVDTDGWLGLVATAVIVANRFYLAGKVNNKEAQPESIDLAVWLGTHLETLPSDDSGQEILTPAINYLLDKTLPDVVTEAGVLAEQAKGETNEGN